MKRLFVLLALLCASNFAYGQTLGTGSYAFSSFDNRGFDSVNLGNLNTRFTIPIVSRTGRGLPFQYSIQNEGMIWQAVNAAWIPDPSWGFSGMLNGTTFSGYLTHSTLSPGCPRPPNYSGPVPFSTTYTNFVYHDPFGASHRFNYTYNSGCPLSNQNPTTTGTGSTTDGSGYSLVGQSQVKTRSGSLITPASSSTGQDNTAITDSNGNGISSTGGNSFVDTLGVSALSITGSSPRVLTYPVTLQSNSATSASATISYRTYTVQTNFQCSGITEYPATSTNLVDRITLADGSYYSFAYETTPSYSGSVTGRLSNITLPTGGTIAYAYSGGCSSAGAGMNVDGTSGNLIRTTSDGVRKYARAPNNSNATSTTLQDEKGNQTVLQFTFDTLTGEFFETHRQAYQGTTSGVLLLDQYTCYNGAPASCDGQAVTLPITEADVTTSYNGGSQAIVKNMYDPVGTLLTSSTQYAGTSVLQKTVTTYNALGEPTRVTSSDSSGNTYADSIFGYDESTPTATSGVPSHSSVSSTRGNLTSTQILASGSTYLKSTTAYYDTGAPLSMVDPGGFTTSYAYDSTQGFVTQTNLPTPSTGVALSTSAQYDASSAAQLTATGMNAGQTTTVNFYDSRLRPTTLTQANGGQIAYVYSAAQVSVYENLNLSTGLNASASVLFDGYGRPTRREVYNGQPPNQYYQADTCYDATGLVSFVSIPYQSTGFGVAAHCSGAGTAYTYDALGRQLSATTSDGTTSTTYKNRAIMTSDVNGIQKVFQYDLTGKLIGVCEISSSNLGDQTSSPCTVPGTSGPVATDIPATGYVTTYAYDLVGQKTTITQGLQSRTFQTDLAGRTTSTFEPERGQTTFTYSYNNTGLVVVRRRPKANQTNAQVFTNTTTQYDTVGRPASITYDDGITPNRYFFYDTLPSGFTQTSTNLKGLLAATSAGSGTTLSQKQLSYDLMGNVLNIWQCGPSICGGPSQNSRPMSFTYDLGNNLTSEADPTSGNITFGITSAGEVSSVTNNTYNNTINPPSLVSKVVNTAFGPTSYALGNGVNTVYSYDSLGRNSGNYACIGSIAPNCTGSTQLWGSSVQYKGGHVIQVCDTVLEECGNSAYDEFNRLTQFNDITHNGGDLGSFTYTYDRWGNRLSEAATTGTQGSTPVSDATNQMTGMAYDAAGNFQGSSATSTFTYNAEGNVVAVGSNGSVAQYVYDAQNYRVRSQTAAGTFEYLFDALGRRISTWQVSNNFGIEGRIYMGSGQQIAFRGGNGGETIFQHKNYLGTERLRTNYQSRVATTESSAPFGEDFKQTVLLTASDQDNDQYAGQEHDSESSSEHAVFRQFSSLYGRWMSPDPYNGSYDVSNPQSLNRYAYALNNPLALTDPLGLSDCPDNQTCAPPGCAYDSCVSTPGCAYDSCVSTPEPSPTDPINAPSPTFPGVPPGQNPTPTPPAPNNGKPSYCQAGPAANRTVVSGNVSVPLTGVGAAIGSLGGPVGAFAGGVIGSLFGAGVSVSYVPSTGSVYVGPTANVGLGISGGGGFSFSTVFVPAGQNPNSIANGTSYSLTYQPTPFTGSTVTKSPGSGPPVVGPSVGSRIPVAGSAGHSFCIYHCGC